jgi:TetR/AcrR family transcriptional regulator, cholesterol catabolism regulator
MWRSLGCRYRVYISRDTDEVAGMSGGADSAEGSPSMRRRRQAARLAEGEGYEVNRRKVIDAAASIFQAKGYQDTTLRDVAATLDIDRATLYRYIAGKEDLLREVLTDCVVEISEGVRQVALGDLPTRAKLDKITHQVLESYDAHYPQPFIFIRELLDATWAEQSEWADDLVRMVREIQADLGAVIERGIREGDLRSDVPTELIVNAVLGMLNWTHRWYRPGGRHASEEVARTFVAILLDGLESDPDPVEPGS